MEYTAITCFPPYNDNVRFVLKKEGYNPLIILGLNPSTANEVKSDKTIDKIRGFIDRWKVNEKKNYDSFIMINLYPLRETDPSKLRAKFKDSDLHNKNLTVIESLLNEYPESEVLVSYGDSIDKITWMKECRDDVLKLLSMFPKLKLFQLGDLTGSKNPRHPSRLAYSTELKRFINPFENYN